MKSKKEKVRYAFKVITALYSRVFIIRYVMVNHSLTTIIYTDGNKNRVEKKRTKSHRWFPTFSDAQKYALEETNKSIRSFQQYVNELSQCELDIVKGKYRVVNPSKSGKIKITKNML
jgi:hypothetical protein